MHVCRMRGALPVGTIYHCLTCYTKYERQLIRSRELKREIVLWIRVGRPHYRPYGNDAAAARTRE